MKKHLKMKELIKPAEALEILDSAAEVGKWKYLRVFNVRSNKDFYTMHKGENKYFFKDPFIYCLDRPEAIRILDRINERILNSNFLTHEIIKEN